MRTICNLLSGTTNVFMLNIHALNNYELLGVHLWIHHQLKVLGVQQRLTQILIMLEEGDFTENAYQKLVQFMMINLNLRTGRKKIRWVGDHLQLHSYETIVWPIYDANRVLFKIV